MNNNFDEIILSYLPLFNSNHSILQLTHITHRPCYKVVCQISPYLKFLNSVKYIEDQIQKTFMYLILNVYVKSNVLYPFVVFNQSFDWLIMQKYGGQIELRAGR